jgi:hypothetical protein
MITLYLIFWEIASLFSKVAESFSTPTNNTQTSRFSTCFPINTCYYLSDYVHPSGFEVGYHCGFDLYFPNHGCLLKTGQYRLGFLKGIRECIQKVENLHLGKHFMNGPLIETFKLYSFISFGVKGRSFQIQVERVPVGANFLIRSWMTLYLGLQVRYHLKSEIYSAFKKEHFLQKWMRNQIE